MIAYFYDTQTNTWPKYFGDIKAVNPQTSYPAVYLGDDRYRPVEDAPAPSYDPSTQSVREIDPIASGSGLTRQWEIVPLTPDQIAANQATAQAAFIDQVTTHTQYRLDTFARTRNYDGILSACTYATSPTAKFASEGQYCVSARDSTWATLYAIMASVEAGTRPMPSSWEEIEAELPELSWPA